MSDRELIARLRSRADTLSSNKGSDEEVYLMDQAADLLEKLLPDRNDVVAIVTESAEGHAAYYQGKPVVAARTLHGLLLDWLNVLRGSSR